MSCQHEPNQHGVTVEHGLGLVRIDAVIKLWPHAFRYGCGTEPNYAVAYNVRVCRLCSTLYLERDGKPVTG